MRTAEDVAASSDRQLTEARAKLQALEKEVAAADNVRSFAAETEREIAQLQRDLREAKTKLAQAVNERDLLERQLEAANEGGLTNLSDGETTAQADMRQYEALIAKAADAQDKLARLEAEHARLRAELAARGDEATKTAPRPPVELAEQVNVLEEAIDSLRANMRAASDETAMMDQSASVVAIAEAVSAAAEHIERARAAVRALQAALD
jgi:flagellar biosynthesis chaperone FliJ